jgi:hypothetical protein
VKTTTDVLLAAAYAAQQMWRADHVELGPHHFQLEGAAANGERLVINVEIHGTSRTWEARVVTQRGAQRRATTRSGYGASPVAAVRDGLGRTR